MIRVGTDIIEVNRIQQSIEKYSTKFLQKVYTEKEIAYCEKYKLSYERFAGKFAAKESAQKALMAALPDTSFPLKKIEILNDSYGRPVIHLRDDLTKFNDRFDLQLSVSHIKEIATATTILVEK